MGRGNQPKSCRAILRITRLSNGCSEVYQGVYCANRKRDGVSLHICGEGGLRETPQLFGRGSPLTCGSEQCDRGRMSAAPTKGTFNLLILSENETPRPHCVRTPPLACAQSEGLLRRGDFRLAGCCPTAEPEAKSEIASSRSSPRQRRGSSQRLLKEFFSNLLGAFQVLNGN